MKKIILVVSVSILSFAHASRTMTLTYNATETKEDDRGDSHNTRNSSSSNTVHLIYPLCNDNNDERNSPKDSHLSAPLQTHKTQQTATRVRERDSGTGSNRCPTCSCWYPFMVIRNWFHKHGCC